MKNEEDRTPYSNLVIDATNLFFRSTTKLLSAKKTPLPIEYVSIILQECFEQVERIKSKFSNDSIVFFVFDNPTSAIEKRMLLSGGDYKHSRKKNNSSEFLYSIINNFIELLKSASDRYRVVRVDGYEADDLTQPLKEYIQPYFLNSCLFVSSDLDWARNIDEEKKCHWYNWHALYDYAAFYQRYKFFPTKSSVILFKSLTGDKSDCIPRALLYASEEDVFSVITSYKSIEELIDSIQQSKLQFSEKLNSKLLEALPQLKINSQLVDFAQFDEKIEDWIYFCKANFKAVKFWCEAHRLKNYTSYFEVPMHMKKKELFSKRIRV